MQIALFKDPAITKSIPRDFGYLKSKEFKLNEDYREFILDYLSILPSSRERESLKIALASKARKYIENLGISYDSHYCLESYGVSTTSRKYMAILSMEDSLDLVLHCISGCDVSAVRNMHKYSEVSRALISLDTHNFDISLGSLIGLDLNLDKYIAETLADYDEVEALSLFLRVILTVSSEILKYTAFKLQSSIDDVVVRSIGKGKVALTSNTSLEGKSIELLGESIKCRYALNINSYKSGSIPSPIFNYGGVI